MAMEIVTLAFPIYQIVKHKRAARETNRVLADFDDKRLASSHDSVTVGSSVATGSLNSKRNGKMYSMESLDECLAGNHDSLQVYASCMELNGENIIFLTRVIAFRQACQQVFQGSCSSRDDFRRARNDMFCLGLSIFITLVHSRTASYPINIESQVYNRLDAIFGPATAHVAMCKSPSRTSSLGTTASITPWDDPKALSPVNSPAEGLPAFPMRTLTKSQPKYASDSNGSSEHMVGIAEQEVDGSGSLHGETEHGYPLEGFEVPGDFDDLVFDAAFKSIRYMVWSETWQRFKAWKEKSDDESPGRAI
ncbi:MAG: hypothetical protein Q9179_000726 [Wetmoreana sp. 5 TL-2023]